MSIFSSIELALNSNAQRTLIGIIGEPGSGKSTLVGKIKELFPADSIAILPMDGYHLSNSVLTDRGIRDIKGAPQTFDALGFTEILKRIKSHGGEDIYFPVFHREIEESIAAEGCIASTVKVVVVEGNYLLHPGDNWDGVAVLLDQSFYIDIPQNIRQERLIARHAHYGKSLADARAWALGSDEMNAKIIRETKKFASSVIEGN